MAPSLVRIARRQGGVFTIDQAIRCGVSHKQTRRRILNGQWIEVLPRVLAAATTPLTARSHAWAGVLAVGTPVALAGRFAASCIGLEQTPSAMQPEFVIPFTRMRRDIAGITVRRTRDTWTSEWHRGLPVPPVAVVLRQLAADVPRHVARDVVQHALRRRRVTHAQLMARLGRGRPGAAALRSVLEELAPGYQASWERRLHRALLRLGVRLKPQVKVVAPDGRIAIIDLGDDTLRFGVEVDGFLNHMARFAADRRRSRLLALELGWTIAPYAVEELAADLAGAAREIAEHVGRRRSHRPAA